MVTDQASCDCIRCDCQQYNYRGVSEHVGGPRITQTKSGSRTDAGRAVPATRI